MRGQSLGCTLLEISGGLSAVLQLLLPALELLLPLCRSDLS
jgi:hypothetical protein